MDNEFPPNSHRAKRPGKPSAEEPKKVEKVIEGEVIRRKKPLGKRFAETFVGGDAKGVAAYVTFDVLIPAAKDMIADATSQGIERLIFGEVRSTSRRGRSSGPTGYGHIAYNRPGGVLGGGSSIREDPRAAPLSSRRSRTPHSFDEIILGTRDEALGVIDGLYELVSKYEFATVAELYDLVGMTGNFTDEKWGWTDIRGADVRRIRDGYLLDLPRPEPLD